MKWGFTGSQKGANIKDIFDVVCEILDDDDVVVTGACVGIDSQVAHLVHELYPQIKQVIIVPANRSKVDISVLKFADELIQMPRDTSYRDRNEKLVEESDKVIAFWTGQKAYSGTFMTITIAKRENKLFKIVDI